MNICHTISSIDKNSGGTSTYLQLLANELSKHITIDIATLSSPEPLLLDEKVTFFSAVKSFPKLLGESIELRRHLNHIDTDLFHGNGMWEYPVHSMAEISRNRKIPYVLSTHGMLNPMSLEMGKWKKRIAMALYQNNDLVSASCIHATAQMEAGNIRKLGFKNPIAIIPNGIDLTEFPLHDKNQLKEKRTVLFLSRLHPQKGIEMLIEAWGMLDKTLQYKWQVEIAGNGEPSYITTLLQLIQSKGLENEIRIIGPQFGEDKLKAYQRADLFVLPTYSENFGIVVAEALACGVPVITTKGAPWDELNTRNAGWWIDIGKEPLFEALNIALNLTNERLSDMGMNGRLLVEENFSIEAVAQKMIQLYEYILHKTIRPDFIDSDLNLHISKRTPIEHSKNKLVSSDFEIHHIVSSIDVCSGGPSYSVTNLSSELNNLGYKSDISTINSKKPLVLPDLRNKLYFVENILLKYLVLHGHLINLITNKKNNVLHGHGIWELPVHIMAVIAQKKKIPYVISPRGTLAPWALRTRNWKKRFAMWLYQEKDLANASCIHATAQMEADNIRKLGFKNSIAVIPNGIDLSEFPFQVKKLVTKKRTLLFLSRVHPQKGIELLVEAWGKLDQTVRQNWMVEIAGNGEPIYIDSLQKLILSKGLENEIRIIGPQFGADKLKTYFNADLFVLPTYSENFGIVIAEALACGVPVITTKGTPWEELNTRNAGWWIEIGVDPLVFVLQEAMQISDCDRQLMGENGRKLVEENYSIESVASKMVLLYRWILNGGEKPEFIY